MREKTNLFLVDDQPILVPDADVTVTTTDVEGESLRDRSGVLHRSPLRRVTAWEFTYERLTDEERAYMQDLLMQEPAFRFTHPDAPEATVCCCRGWSGDYHDASRGIWKNFRFRVEEV